MTKKAVILSTQPEITALIAIKSECTTCKASCSKNKNVVTLANPHNFTLKENSVVLIESEKKYQILQGIFSLFLPVILSFTGYFVSTPIMQLFGITATDPVKALFVIAFFVITCTVIFLVSRFSHLPGKPQIVEIIS